MKTDEKLLLGLGSLCFLILVDSFMSKNNVVKRVLWILEFNFFFGRDARVVRPYKAAVV